MNTTQKWTASLAALTGLGMLTLGSAGTLPAGAQIPPPRIVRPQGNHARIIRVHKEQHPELRRALKNLNQAKGNLQIAAHDFGGHRQQALDLVQRAIDQTQQALANDNR